MIRSVIATAGTLVLLAVSHASAVAQETADGAHESSPPTLRFSDGTVDLSGNGVWDLPWIQDFSNVIVGGDEDTDAPLLPWTKAMRDYNRANRSLYDPEGFCLPPGGPRAFGTPYPAEIIQHRDRIIIIFEGGGHVWREIHLDGRPHPEGEALNPTYFGHSVGRWEGDTLVVDTVGYNEKTWLDYSGHMHTDQMHTLERITRPDRDTLHYEVTITDPGAYSAPWTIAWDIPWSEGQELADYICQENNQFLIDLKDDFGNPFFEKTTGAE